MSRLGLIRQYELSPRRAWKFGSCIAVAKLLSASIVYGGGKGQRLKIASSKMASLPEKNARILTGDEPILLARNRTGHSWVASGPGEELDFTYYDYGTNGSMPRTIHNDGDATVAVAMTLLSMTEL